MRRIRLEGVGVVLLHVALVYGLGLSPGRYLLLYALYGLNWSAQQYVTHAGSPPARAERGAQPAAARLYELLLLHFNWHLAHHQHPRVPWLYLPRYDDATRVRPGYLTAFLRFWAGLGPRRSPRRLPSPESHPGSRGTPSAVETHLAELREHLGALPLGESREAVLAVVAAMTEGEHVEQRPGTTWAEAFKRRWLQSGDTC